MADRGHRSEPSLAAKPQSELRDWWGRVKPVLAAGQFSEVNTISVPGAEARG